MLRCSGLRRRGEVSRGGDDQNDYAEVMTPDALTPTQTIERVVLSPLVATYGNTDTSRSCASYLAGRIHSFDPGDQRNRRGRTNMIQTVCWDFFAGGDTAEAIAKEIESALQAAGL